MTYRKEKQFKNVDDRYRDVSFQDKLAGGQYAYILNDALGGTVRVIVPEIYAKDISEEKLKNKTLLFLERKTGANNWIAAPWGRKKNPWISGFPIVGTPILGKVSSFVNAEIAIAHVEIQGKGMEASILREHLPDTAKSRDIREVLNIGDIIKGNFRTPDYDNLRLSLNVQAWVSRQHLKWGKNRASFGESFTPASISPDELAEMELRKDNWHKHLQGKTILHIEDDNLICELYRQRFQNFGAEVKIISEITSDNMREDVYKALAQKPDFILLDFQLNISGEDSNEIRASVISYLARNTDAACAIISGNINAAQRFAYNNKIGCLLKPIPPAEVMDWMCDPKAQENGIKNKTALEESPFWARKNRTKQTIGKANALLDALCERFELKGALWFIELHYGVFELRAYSGEFSQGLPSNVIPKLSQSVIGNSALGGKVINRELPDNDPLLGIEQVNQIRGVLNPYVHCLPITLDGQGARVVAFFNNSKFSDDAIKAIDARKDHFQLLIDNINQAEAIDEIAASATIGRQALGAMHEIRHATTKMVSLLEPIEGSNSEEKLALVRVLMKEITGLSFGLMSNYQPVREESFVIGDVVQKIRDVFGPYMRDVNEDYMVDLNVDVEAIKDVRLALSPIPLERTLSNLLENANTFVAYSPLAHPQNKHVRKIWIRGMRDDNAVLPIKITVSDTGPGLDVKSYETLFRPRHTSNLSTGTGLGLYLSRRLMESIGGSLEVDPTPRWGGARFVISLPERIG